MALEITNPDPKAPEPKVEETKPNEPTQEDLVNHWKAKAEAATKEREELIKARDKYKSQSDTLLAKLKVDSGDDIDLSAPERKSKADVMAAYAKTAEENAALKKQLEDIQNKSVFENKKAVLQRVAKKEGLKDTYLDRIDNFVDLTTVDLDAKDTSAHIAVRVFKETYPDLFGSTGVSTKTPGLPRFESDSPASNSLVDAYHQALADVAKKVPGARERVSELVTLADQKGIALR